MEDDTPDILDVQKTNYYKNDVIWLFNYKALL